MKNKCLQLKGRFEKIGLGEACETKHKVIIDGAKNILLFPGKGHSSPGVAPTFVWFSLFPESFKALRSLIRSRGFFFPGVPSQIPFDKVEIVWLGFPTAKKQTGPSTFAYFLYSRTVMPSWSDPRPKAKDRINPRHKYPPLISINTMVLQEKESRVFIRGKRNGN